MTRIQIPRARAHPGRLLLEQFIRPAGIRQTDLAERIGVSYPRLNEIIHGKRAVTPDTALRLEMAFGAPAEFWLGLQVAWDLELAKRAGTAREIARIKPIRPRGAARSRR